MFVGVQPYRTVPCVVRVDQFQIVCDVLHNLFLMVVCNVYYFEIRYEHKDQKYLHNEDSEVLLPCSRSCGNTLVHWNSLV